MKPVRQKIGGLGNLMFKQAYILGKYLDGDITDPYLQSEKYWAKHKDAIKKEFGGDAVKTDMVALHIRRGDYLSAQHFHKPLWDTEYYKQAVAMFPNERFLVFCKDNQDPAQDKLDRLWCRENLTELIGDRWEMAPYEDTEVEDLNLMAGCKSLIMANSSFSWWAAYLGNHEKVVCPKEWFVDGKNRIDLLDEWIKI